MALFDGWILADQDGLVRNIGWRDDEAEGSAEAGPEGRRMSARRPESLAEMGFDRRQESLNWAGERFLCQEIALPDHSRLILLKKEDRRKLLYEFALDEIKDGVQIYDDQARMIHLNRASRQISGIPGHLEVSGKHLMELYDLDPEISTVMTALKTRRPVINRFDNFKSAGGSDIISVNTAYPVFDNQELVGSVVFEQNLESIREQIDRLEERRKTIKEKTSLPISKFSGYQFSDLIGSNRDFQVAVTLARKIAPQQCNILLVGETGTGKEIFAQSIHKASDRRIKKFVAVNCAAVPDTLIESMFFGTSRGSFTGSLERPGLLEEANGGILFLDELNSMSLSMQSKLLRVIQEGAFRRLGGSQDISADIRFISSCNEDPSALIDQNILRKDLFYRLSTVTIDIPPLRDRRDDIEELVSFYLAKHIGGYLKTVEGVSPQVMELFHQYNWPGNIRELFNVLDYVLNTVESDRVELKHLPRHLAAFSAQEAGPTGRAPGLPSPAPPSRGAGEAAAQSAAQPTPAVNQPGYGGAWSRLGQDSPLSNSQGPETDLKNFLLGLEKNIIGEALLKNRYNLSKTAAHLNLSRQNLQYRIKKLGL